MRRPAKRGFTLLEVLLVVVLIGVLAAFAWPDFATADQAEHLKEAGRRMEAVVAMCRAQAMNESCRYRVVIRPDGSLHVRRQLDVLKAPHVYVRVLEPWANPVFPFDDVWVSALQVLPEGPPPVHIIDERLQFPDTEVEPQAIEEFEDDVTIDFAPDGLGDSLRWVLRDTLGRGLLQTLDGRLGRVTAEDWPRVPLEDLERPETLPAEEEPEYKLEDFQ